MPGQAFSPNTTLLVILGASEWPSAPKLPGSEAFKRSANDLVEYFTGTSFFRLPNDEFHVLNLFDYAGSPLEIDRKLVEWLRAAQQHSREKAGIPISDLIVYYVGHGGFTPGGEQAYFLALRSTVADSEGISSLRMTDLARTLKREAKNLRRYLMLDCCFAESAYELFMSEGGDPAHAAHAKALLDFPGSGTALLCSSSARDVSIAPKGQSHTMFTGALLEVLRTGDVNGGPSLSLQHVGDRVARVITEKYTDIGVRPKVSSPDEREGDIADIPIFPNASQLVRPVEQRLRYSEEKIEVILNKLSALDEFVKRRSATDQQRKEETSSEEDERASISQGVERKKLKQPRELTLYERERREERILQSAPPITQAEVHLYTQAVFFGKLWVAGCVVLGFLAAGPFFAQNWRGFEAIFPSTNPLINPFSYMVIGLIAISSVAWRNEKRRAATAVKPEKTKSDYPRTWESLPIVIAMRTRTVIPLFGGLRVAEPYFEIGILVLLASVAFIATLFLARMKSY